MPKVSVILPTYNCAQYLPDSLLSVSSQTFEDLEILVIDDGSTDGTEELMAKSFLNPKIIYIKQEHAGLSSARNKGIEKTSGEYIAFIDADDLYLKDKIEKQVLVFEKYKSANIAYTCEKYFYEDDKEKLFESPHEKLSGDLLFFLKRSNFIHVSTVMIRRSVLGNIRFDPSLKSHEDWDFFLALAQNGLKFFYLPESLSLVRVRRKSMTAVDSVMDSSRKIVGERAKNIWGGLKNGINLYSIEGIERLFRYSYLRIRAGLLNFPDDARFNRPSFFKTIKDI